MKDYSNVWAFLKDGKVIQTIIFEGDEPFFLNQVKDQFGADDFISGAGSEFQPGIGWGYDYEEKKFILPTE